MTYLLYWYLCGIAGSVVLLVLEKDNISLKGVIDLALWSLLGPIWLMICLKVIANELDDKIVWRKRK